MTIGECSDYTTQSTCENEGCYWYNGSCQEEYPTASQLNNESDCTRFGYYWYNSTCNSSPQTNTLVLLATEGGNPYAGGTELYSDDDGASWTTEANDDVYFRIYGDRVAGARPTDIYASGYITRYQKRQIVGYHSDAGDLRSIEVTASGAILTDTGSVEISGQTVVVASGAYIASGIGVVTAGGVQVSGTVEVSGRVSVLSGLVAVLSGEVHIMSGVASISGNVVSVSGNLLNVQLYGYHVASGEWKPIAVNASGCIAMVYALSGGIF